MPTRLAVAKKRYELLRLQLTDYEAKLKQPDKAQPGINRVDELLAKDLEVLKKERRMDLENVLVGRRVE